MIVVTTKQGHREMKVNYSMSLTMGLKPQQDANLMIREVGLGTRVMGRVLADALLPVPSRGGCRDNGNGSGK
ncbi:MAG: hypothetical protein ACLUDU_06170 [Butyricimonas faecihominis]